MFPAQDEPVTVPTIPTDLGVVSDSFDVSTITGSDILFALAAIVVSVVLAQLTKRAMRRVLSDIDGMPVLSGDVIARMVSYTIILLGVVIALEALGFSLGPVGAILLVVIVVVVLSARPLFEDLGAGVILQMRRPFHVGDVVEFGEYQGAIEEVNARTVRMVSVDGRRVHIPNRTALDGTIVNLMAHGARMTTFVAGVEYATDLDRTREVVVGALQSCEMVADEPVPEAHVQEFNSSTIDIACRFWHAPGVHEEWRARDEAMRAVKRALDADGITIAFPQRVLWRGDEA